MSCHQRASKKTLVMPQIYNGAHHLKAFSGLKINCSPPQTGSGDEGMNRPHEKTERVVVKRLKLFSEMGLYFTFTRDDSVV